MSFHTPLTSFVHNIDDCPTYKPNDVDRLERISNLQPLKEASEYLQAEQISTSLQHPEAYFAPVLGFTARLVFLNQ